MRRIPSRAGEPHEPPSSDGAATQLESIEELRAIVRALQNERAMLGRQLTEAGIPEEVPIPDQPGDNPETERAAQPMLRALPLEERLHRLIRRLEGARLLADGMVAHCSTVPLRVAGRHLIDVLEGRPVR